MRGNRNIRATGAALVFMAAALPMGLASPAGAQAANPVVMKLSTATINDTQHEWLKRFAAAVEKDSGGRIKGEIYPASSARRHPSANRGRAIRSDPGLGWTAGIPRRR